VGPCCRLAFLEVPGCNSALEVSVASPVENLVAGKKALEVHRQAGAALEASGEDHNWALEVEACSLVVPVWDRSWAFAEVAERSLASALAEEERSWDEVLEAVDAVDIEASAASAGEGPCKQALLVGEEEACMLAWSVLVVCMPASSSLAAYKLASSEGEAVDCMTELACLLHKSALAGKEQWLDVVCEPHGLVERCLTGRSALAARGEVEEHTSLLEAPSTSLRILRWNKTALVVGGSG